MYSKEKEKNVGPRQCATMEN